uniref:Uncharacterized protein n=1 Tax=Odontella aurita TaxID=265563 RepID=A0A7S4N6D4_9STRA|mmetsp:Transcript_49261/g.148275  ORF Transcript_49261/g.148275 Transcript_49261/m.148275 type:complete len:114 (+) Transcript_49261:467-808(+)
MSSRPRAVFTATVAAAVLASGSFVLSAHVGRPAVDILDDDAAAGGGKIGPGPGPAVGHYEPPPPPPPPFDFKLDPDEEHRHLLRLLNKITPTKFERLCRRYLSSTRLFSGAGG